MKWGYMDRWSTTVKVEGLRLMSLYMAVSNDEEWSKPAGAKVSILLVFDDATLLWNIEIAVEALYCTPSWALSCAAAKITGRWVQPTKHNEAIHQGPRCATSSSHDVVVQGLQCWVCCGRLLVCCEEVEWLCQDGEAGSSSVVGSSLLDSVSATVFKHPFLYSLFNNKVSSGAYIDSMYLLWWHVPETLIFANSDFGLLALALVVSQYINYLAAYMLSFYM